MMTERQKVELEMLIDGSSLNDVVSALAQIAHEKAEHIRSCYQDRVTAAPWNKAGNFIEQCSNNLMKLPV